MESIVARIETLLNKRAELVERFAQLWAVHGGSSSTWEKALVDSDLAPLKVEIRRHLAANSPGFKEGEFKERLEAHPDYRSRILRNIQSRTEWVEVKEAFRTLEWRIQLEMAKLRLALGEDHESDRDVSESEDS